jgi:hypothetical protein
MNYYRTIACREARLKLAERLPPYLDEPWLDIHKGLYSMIPPGTPLFDEINLRANVVDKSKEFKEFELAFRKDILNAWRKNIKHEPTNVEITKIEKKLYNRIYRQAS